MQVLNILLWSSNNIFSSDDVEQLPTATIVAIISEVTSNPYHKSMIHPQGPVATIIVILIQAEIVDAFFQMF